MTITPELKEAIERAGSEPVRLTDPATKDAYYLLKEEVYERIRDVIAPIAAPQISEGMRLAQEAFFRDLPGMLGDAKLKGRWVAYHRDQRIAVGRKQRDVLEEVIRRGVAEDDFCTFVVREQLPDPEEVDFPSAWR